MILRTHLFTPLDILSHWNIFFPRLSLHGVDCVSQPSFLLLYFTFNIYQPIYEYFRVIGQMLKLILGLNNDNAAE